MSTGWIDAPCQGCEKRQVGCHSQCEAYKAYKVEAAAFNKTQNCRRVVDEYFAHQVVRRENERQKWRRSHGSR